MAICIYTYKTRLCAQENTNTPNEGNLDTRGQECLQYFMQSIEYSSNENMHNRQLGGKKV